MISRGIAPCRGCERRKVTEDYNCHSHCPDYLAYRADIDARKAGKLVEIGLNEYNSSITYRIQKRKHRHHRADQ